MGVFTLRSSLDVDVNEVPDLIGVVGLLVFLEHLLQELVDRHKGPHQTIHHLPHTEQGTDHKALQAFFKKPSVSVPRKTDHVLSSTYYR